MGPALIRGRSRFMPKYEGPERRSREENGIFSSLPMWARVVAIVGIPGTLLSYLIYIGAQTLPAIQAELTALRIASEKNQLLYQSEVTQSEATFRLLQRICSNVAKSQEERQRCFDR